MLFFIFSLFSCVQLPAISGTILCSQLVVGCLSLLWESPPQPSQDHRNATNVSARMLVLHWLKLSLSKDHVGIPSINIKITNVTTTCHKRKLSNSHRSSGSIRTSWSSSPDINLPLARASHFGSVCCHFLLVVFLIPISHGIVFRPCFVRHAFPFSCTLFGERNKAYRCWPWFRSIFNEESVCSDTSLGQAQCFSRLRHCEFNLYENSNS